MQWEGGGAVNPHRISVTGIDAGGTSHILNAAARGVNRGHGGGIGHASPLGSPVVGSPDGGEGPGIGSGGGEGAYRGKHRQAPKQAKLKKVVNGASRYRAWAETVPQAENHVEHPAVSPATAPGAPLTSRVQQAALGGQRQALPVGSYRSASGEAPEWAGSAQPQQRSERQYRSAAGNPRVIQGQVERVADAIPMPRVPGPISGEAPEPVKGFKVQTPPRYEKGMRPYSPTAGGTPMHARKPRTETTQAPVAEPEPAPAPPAKTKTPRRKAVAAKPVEAVTAAPAAKPTRKRKAVAPTAAAPAPVETAAAPAIEAPPRARKQAVAKPPTAKETVGGRPAAPQRIFGPVMPARMADRQRDVHARQALAAAPRAQTSFASPEVGQGRRKRDVEAGINDQNARALNERGVRGGYQVPTGADAAARRAAARAKLGIPDDVD